MYLSIYIYICTTLNQIIYLIKGKEHESTHSDWAADAHMFYHMQLS